VPGLDSTQQTVIISRWVAGSPPTLTQWGGTAAGNGNAYGFGLLQDSTGQVALLGNDVIFSSDGSSNSSASWLSGYGVIAPTAYFVNQSSSISWDCFNGTSFQSTYGSGITDGYGLALGADGSLYGSQGNHNPAAVYKIPPGGGAATTITTVPMAVVTVEADSAGQNIYLAGYGDGNTVWQLNLATGVKTVYGCDPNSTRACGATE